MSGTRVGVFGVGAVGAFGAGVDALERALAAPPPEPRRIPIALEGRSGETVLHACETARLEEYVPRKALRRFDHFSRLALLGAYLALEDAGVRLDGAEDAGLVIASGYGVTPTNFAFLDSFLVGGDPLSSPTLFSHSVHNAGAGNVSIALGICGPNLTVSQFEMSVFSALLTAVRWIEEGRVERVLFGAIDLYCNVLGYSRLRFFGPEGGGPMRPLDLARHSAVAAEGAAYLLLGRDEARTAPYGAISEVRLGAGEAAAAGCSAQEVFFLGANGHGECGAGYPRVVPAGSAVAAYAPLYGSLPVGPAFDLAIAALSVRRDRVAPSPCPADGHPWREIAAAEHLGGRRIRCVACGTEETCGTMLVER